MKTFKIISAIIILLGIMLSLSACGSDISGKYTFHSVTLTELDGVDISAFESYDDVVIELFEDGSGTVESSGEVSYLEYNDKYIWPAGYETSKVSYTYKNGKLSIVDENGMTWVYKKN